MAIQFDYSAYINMSPDEQDKNFPNRRVCIPGEGMHGRTVGKDLVMLNNDPLDPNYRYADIWRVRGNDAVELIYRTFPQRIGVLYRPLDSNTDLIADALDTFKDQSSMCFMRLGQMHFSFTKDLHVDTVMKILFKLPIIQVVDLNQNAQLIYEA